MSIGPTSESSVYHETSKGEPDKKLQSQKGCSHRSFVGHSTFQAAIEATQANSDMTSEQKEDHVKFLQKQIRIQQALTTDIKLNEDAEARLEEEKTKSAYVRRRGGFIGVATHEALLERARTDPDLTPEQRKKEIEGWELHVGLYRDSDKR